MSSSDSSDDDDFFDSESNPFRSDSLAGSTQAPATTSLFTPERVVIDDTAGDEAGGEPSVPNHGVDELLPGTHVWICGVREVRMLAQSQWTADLVRFCGTGMQGVVVRHDKTGSSSVVMFEHGVRDPSSDGVDDGRVRICHTFPRATLSLKPPVRAVGVHSLNANDGALRFGLDPRSAPLSSKRLTNAMVTCRAARQLAAFDRDATVSCREDLHSVFAKLEVGDVAAAKQQPIPEAAATSAATLFKLVENDASPSIAWADAAPTSATARLRGWRGHLAAGNVEKARALTATLPARVPTPIRDFVAGINEGHASFSYALERASGASFALTARYNYEFCRTVHCSSRYLVCGDEVARHQAGPLAITVRGASMPSCTNCAACVPSPYAHRVAHHSLSSKLPSSSPSSSSLPWVPCPRGSTSVFCSHQCAHDAWSTFLAVERGGRDAGRVFRSMYSFLLFQAPHVSEEIRGALALVLRCLSITLAEWRLPGCPAAPLPTMTTSSPLAAPVVHSNGNGHPVNGSSQVHAQAMGNNNALQQHQQSCRPPQLLMPLEHNQHKRGDSSFSASSAGAALSRTASSVSTPSLAAPPQHGMAHRTKRDTQACFARLGVFPPPANVHIEGDLLKFLQGSFLTALSETLYDCERDAIDTELVVGAFAAAFQYQRLISASVVASSRAGGSADVACNERRIAVLSPACSALSDTEAANCKLVWRDCGEVALVVTGDIVPRGASLVCM